MKFKLMSTTFLGAAFLLSFSFNVMADRPQKNGVCHANNGSDGYSFISVADSAYDNHINRQTGDGQEGHEMDYPADNASECEGTTGGGGNPGAVPEPITILLFGAGLTGVGYVSRRLRKKGNGEDDQQS